ncbi:DUF2277 domain-containing protein [uncultured Paludibaculum sp.]|uniref:DUF2277 domain-containing protein n=1 Tax=uncultured Paludibaculum sp. TaxID=1765020 RepID=UPI00374D37E2
MCRSIKVLRNQEPPVTPAEIDAAALQFVRKISGFQKPSKANQEAFERAVREISAASGRLLQSIAMNAPLRRPPARVEGE